MHSFQTFLFGKGAFCYTYKTKKFEQIDAKGYKTFYRYDLLGHLIEKREPVKEEYHKVLYKLTCFTYDLNGNKIEEKHGLDFVAEEGYPRSYHSIYLSYDQSNHLIKVKDDYGAMMRYEYNCLGQRSYEEREINAEVSQCIRYLYNKAGWLIAKKEALDSRTLGEKSARTLWAVTKYDYDANGNLIKILTPKGYTIERDYAACDCLISKRVIDQANGIDRTTHYTYDAAHNIIKVEELSEGVAPNKREYTYDLKDRLTHIQENEKVIKRYFYNQNDQLIKEVNGINYKVTEDDGLGTCYTYDLQGNRIQTINPLGQIIEENTYDVAGNLLIQKDALGNPITYDYTIQNQLSAVSTAKTQAQGRKLQTYSYNANGQITGIIDGNHNETFYQVDGWGRITEVTAADGGVEKYTYNYSGNITTTTDANGGTITYHYNSFGKVSEIIDQEGLSEKFYYDEEGRLTIHLDRNGNRVENTYNIDGNLVSQVATSENGEQEPVRKSYTYDSKGQLLTAKADGFLYNYSYTPEGYLKSKSTCGCTLIAYTYNSDGQIASIKDVTGKTTYYKYDILGRIDELIDDSGTIVAKYSYLPNNLIESITYGNGIKTTYTYDSDQNISHLLTVKSNGEKLQDFTYQYDLNGNRLSKVGLNQDTHFTYDNMNRLIKANYNERTESFTYDLVGNRLSHTVNNENTTFIYNTKNQLTQLSKDLGITNFTYDAFGNTLESQEQVHNRIRYTGQQYDAITQQYYLRARFYNPILGRFMQEDVYRGDGLNLYVYCSNNPTMYYDPSGYTKQRELAQQVKNMTSEQIKEALKKQYEEFKTNKLANLSECNDELISVTYGKKKNKVTTELTIASYGNTPKPSKDDMTPHHMPAADSIQNDGIGYKDGICTNVKTSTHYLTFTYGMGDSDTRAYDYALYNSLSYEERLDFDIENLRWAYSVERPNVDMNEVNSALKKHKDEAMKVYNEAQNKKSNTVDEVGKCN